MTNSIKIILAFVTIFFVISFAAGCEETEPLCPQILDAPGGGYTEECEGKLKLNGILDGRIARDKQFRQRGQRVGNLNKIWANKRSNRLRVNKLSVVGTCCWKVSDRYGETQEFELGTSDVVPRIAYIRHIRGMRCDLI